MQMSFLRKVAERMGLPVSELADRREVRKVKTEVVAAILSQKVLSIAAINILAIALAVRRHHVLAWGMWVLAVLLCGAEWHIL